MTQQLCNGSGEPHTRAVLSTGAFALVLVGELIGRPLFYDSMIRIGM